MASLNKVHLIGNVTAKPTDEKTVGGTSVTHFSLAINEYKKAADGTRQNATSFIDLVAYGQTADGIKQYVSKGDPLYVEAALRQESWTDKTTGKERRKLVVLINNVQYLAPRRDREQQPAPPQQQRPQQRTTEEDDGIPF